MPNTKYSEIFETLYKMKRHFRSGATRPLEHRRRHLEKLKAAVIKYETAILEALANDLGKHAAEAYATEVGFVVQDLNHTLANLDDWASAEQIDTPWTLLGSSAKIVPEPKGLVLILSPWNYPFQLAITPLVAAIAAGNSCVIKPSEFTEKTTLLISKIIQEVLPSDQFLCVQGDAAFSASLLEYSWDHVFFTGSTQVGRLVAKACAEHLTPMTLELGGKSPCIVDSTCNISQAAKKIVWGKFTNAGQTCVAPDYVLVHESKRDELVKHLLMWIRKFYGDNPQASSSYGRIINHKNFDRLVSMIHGGSQIHGGKHERLERFIEPTIIDGVTLDHPTMREEIFGPILPIMTWREVGQLHTILDANPNPLAFYLFTKDENLEKELLEAISFGGATINHTLLHLAVPDLPFGGIRQSGLGSYHGKAGFDAFSHFKSILSTSPIDDMVKYPPHSNWKLKVLRFILGGRLK